MKMFVSLIVITLVAMPAAAQGWSVAIEENAMHTSCGTVKDIPVAGATDCESAKKAALDLFQKLKQIPGCGGSCPAGSAMSPPVVTCKYDPYTRPSGAKANRWQIHLGWTCTPTKVISVPCCKCLGEASVVNVSTGQGAPIDPFWKMNGGNAYTTPPYPGWMSLPPARWIQPVASPLPSPSAPANTVFKYTLQFTVPRCTIPRDVSLTGSFAADNNAKVFFDNNPIITCPGPSCFKAATPLNIPSIAAGTHTLEIQVGNNSGPSGLLVNAQLKAQCKKE